jgi:hypothetical protein
VTSTFAAALVATSLRLVASHAYPDGAPPGFTGGFREESCHGCHFHAQPNTPPGSVAVTGIPATFSPGQRYPLTITLTHADMKRAGFQLAARFKDTGAQAGALERVQADLARVKIDNLGGIEYANQSRGGSTVDGGGVVRWIIEWIAPTTAGTVTFNVSANAADGDEAATGDFIYTAAIDTAPSLAEEHARAHRHRRLLR